MEYTIDAINGTYTIPHSSYALDRVISIRPHTQLASGTAEIKARPFGRSEFMQISGAESLDLTQEHSVSAAYPMAELQVVISGASGGTVIFVTIADGV